jgi:hypothetical protein
METGEVRSFLCDKRTIDVPGFKVGLIHGWGSPMGLEKRIKAQFPPLDCLITPITLSTTKGVESSFLTLVRQFDPSPAVIPLASFHWKARSKGRSLGSNPFLPAKRRYFVCSEWG